MELVILTGCHGANTVPVSVHLEQLGYPVLFPGQDLDLEVYDANGQVLYDQWRQNIEVLRIHEATLRDNKLSWHHPEGGIKAAISPQPLLDQFGDRLQVHDPRACLLMGLWRQHNPKIIFVDVDWQQALPGLLEYGITEPYWRYLHDLYLAKIQPHLSSALRLSVADMASGDWVAKVDQFLGVSDDVVARTATTEV